jgi:hypothetical protein
MATPVPYPCMNGIECDPAKDGVEHLNVYSKAKTELGQMLSNFAFTPFKHPQYGHFASMEAFWYWLSTGKKHDNLRRLYGLSAKMAGRKLDRVESKTFREEICEAIQLKIAQSYEIQSHMKSTIPLPLLHYYVYPYGTTHGRVVPKPEHTWQLEPVAATWVRLYAQAHPQAA